MENNTIATFTDHAAILAFGNSHEEAPAKLQKTIKQRIKLNKSAYKFYQKERLTRESVRLNNAKVLLYVNTAKYLGITLDEGLRWKPSCQKEKRRIRTQIELNTGMKFHSVYILYKQILKPVWTCGI